MRGGQAWTGSPPDLRSKWVGEADQSSLKFQLMELKLEMDGALGKEGRGAGGAGGGGGILEGGAGDKEGEAALV